MRADRFSILLIFVAIVRIAATLNVLSATTDEPVHVTAGVQLLLQHRYDLLPPDAPLPNLLFAAPIVAAGADFNPEHEAKWYIGRTFYSRGEYRTNLVLGRAANLLFFLIAALAVWRIARRELGETGGCVAMFLFTMQPLILGFAGIANHDMPSTAGMALALLAYARWMEQRTAARALVFGLAYGLAVGLKLSCLVFVPPACLALYLVKSIRSRDFGVRSAAIAFPIALAGAMLALWAAYGFLIGPAGRFAHVPAPHFFRGIEDLLRYAKGGFSVYALGRWKHDGWWWYFPLAIAVKTTLASLLLAVAAFFVRERRDVFVAWLASALAILAVAMPTNFDLGVRYILPLYVPLSIAIAAVTTAMLRDTRRAIRVTAGILLAWHGIASLAAHPQYFAYFNELVIGDPSRVLLDSNIDWGQDALILKRVLREKGIDSIGLNITGMHDFSQLGYPTNYPVDPDIPATGWVAVSDHHYRMHRGGWRWLRGRKYERVGAAVRLYFIPHT